MSVKSFWKGFLDGVANGTVFGGAAYILASAGFWIVENYIDQDEQIEELFSRLEKCEKNHDQEKQIKELFSRLEKCEKNHELEK